MGAETVISVVLAAALIILLAVLHNINERNAAFRVMQNVAGSGSSAPYAAEDVPPEVVAAIAAAVACVYPGAEVRSVRRAVDTRSAWKLAGLLENTRPF